MNLDIPPPLRAAAGLAARTFDEARALPNRLVSLPVLAVGAALQVSLKVQQQYAGLVARGDELITTLRRHSDEPPPWATFDEDLPADGAVAPARSAFDRVVEPSFDTTPGLNSDLDVEADLDLDIENSLDAAHGLAAVQAHPDPAVAPLAGYDSWTIAQLRARLRRLSPAELRDLVRYEEGGRARAAYLTMLQNRLAKPRPRSDVRT